MDFAYDGQGRRVSADRGSSGQRYVVGPTGNQSLESPHLVHNGAFLTGELVYGGEHALWRYQGDGTIQTRVYLRDAMGSVIGLMDENGQLIETFEYDAFGNVRSPGGEALPEVSFGGDSRFQGMWKDSGTGLYYVRARYYDSRTGRFLSRDPAEGDLDEPETFLPYAFGNSNPFVFRDPTGLFSLGELNATRIVQNVLSNLARPFRFVTKSRPFRFVKDFAKAVRLRSQYMKAVRELAKTRRVLQQRGASPEQVARQLQQLRRVLGQRFKELTPEPFRSMIARRNLARYGDELGPTLEKLLTQGKTWEQIAESASRPGGWLWYLF